MGALCLTRRAGESILIGDDIEILITEVKASAVRVSIRAPANVKILRNEVAARDAAEVDGNK